MNIWNHQSSSCLKHLKTRWVKSGDLPYGNNTILFIGTSSINGLFMAKGFLPPPTPQLRSTQPSRWRTSWVLAARTSPTSKRVKNTSTTTLLGIWPFPHLVIYPNTRSLRFTLKISWFVPSFSHQLYGCGETQCVSSDVHKRTLNLLSNVHIVFNTEVSKFIDLLLNQSKLSISSIDNIRSWLCFETTMVTWESAESSIGKETPENGPCSPVLIKHGNGKS